MLHMIALKETTLHQARVIARQSNDINIGIIKSLLIDQLRDRMVNGVARFCYLKKDGSSLREAFGTLKSNLIQNHINGRGYPRSYHNCFAYWDCECGEWRSFKINNLIAIL